MRQTGYVPLSSDVSSPTLPSYQEGELYEPKRQWPPLRVFKYVFGAFLFLALASGVTRQLSRSRIAPKNDSTAPLADSRIVPPSAYTLSDAAVDYGPLTFIPYTYGYEMLTQALKVYKRAHWKNIVVVDNSWDHDAWNDRDQLKEYGVVEVVVTTTHMKFAQIQNTIEALAFSLGHEYYMWAHSDVFLISAQPSPHDTVISCIDQRLKASSDIGILYFDYDYLSMVKVEAAKAAPWDPAMNQYASDCERRSRMIRAGYKTVESIHEDGCPEIRAQLGQLFNMPGILSDEELEIVLSQEASFEARLDVVNNVVNSTDKYSWRGQGKGGLGVLDEKALASYETGGHQYYADKWGRPMVPGCDHELHYVAPNFDVPSLAPPRSPPPVRPVDEEGEEISTEEKKSANNDEVPVVEDVDVIRI